MTHAALDVIINTLLTATLIIRAVNATDEMIAKHDRYNAQWNREFQLHACGRQAAALANLGDAAAEYQQKRKLAVRALEHLSEVVKSWSWGEYQVSQTGCKFYDDSIQVTTYRLDESHQKGKLLNWSYRMALKDEV